MTSCVYVYGIVEESGEQTTGYAGIGGAETYKLVSDGLAAVVSRVDDDVVDPTRRNVLAHVMVQNELMKGRAFLPFGFGMVGQGEDAVKALLASNHDAFLAEMRRLSGKIEANLKVLWDREAIIGELKEKDSGFARLTGELGKAPPGTASVLLTEIGKRVEAVTLDWQKRYGGKIYERLRSLAVDSIMNGITAPECILSASFLIEEAGEEAFKARIFELDAEYAGRLGFKYVSPLPPYSFVRMRIKGDQEASYGAVQAPI